MNRYLRIAALSAAVGLSGAPAAAADTSTRTLSVQASGRAFVTPDVADLSVSVSRSAASARGALSAANRGADAVVGAIRALGVPGAEIQTQGVSVSSSRPPARRHHPSRTVWTAVESLGVHLTRIELTGRAIDVAAARGASTIDGPYFSFSDPSAGLLPATRAALTAARRRADDAAGSMGYHVSDVQSVQLDPQGYSQSSAGAPSAKQRAPSTPTTIRPGTEEVDASVAVVYVISPNS